MRFNREAPLMTSRPLLAAIACTLLLPGVAATPAHAQDNYPTKPIRWIVTYAVGGGVDISARIYTAKMAEILGQQILVDNRPGAGGVIGADAGAKAAPDGYTVLNADTATFGINPWLYKKLPYDPDKDFAPVGQAIATSFTLSVPASFPATDLKSFVSAVRAAPGKYSYGSPGLGTMPHLCAERMKSAAGGLDIVHAAYRGAGPAVNDLVAGQIAMSFLVPATLKPHMEGGKLRGLGVATPVRDPALPTVPTLDEQGMKGIDCTAWFGVFAPAKTPDAIVRKLNAALNAALADKQIQERLAATGLRPTPGTTPESFDKMVRDDRAQWGPVVKGLGMQLE